MSIVGHRSRVMSRMLCHTRRNKPTMTECCNPVSIWFELHLLCSATTKVSHCSRRRPLARENNDKCPHKTPAKNEKQQKCQIILLYKSHSAMFPRNNRFNFFRARYVYNQTWILIENYDEAQYRVRLMRCKARRQYLLTYKWADTAFCFCIFILLRKIQYIFCWLMI